MAPELWSTNCALLAKRLDSLGWLKPPNLAWPNADSVALFAGLRSCPSLLFLSPRRSGGREPPIHLHVGSPFALKNQRQNQNSSDRLPHQNLIYFAGRWSVVTVVLLPNLVGSRSRFVLPRKTDQPAKAIGILLLGHHVTNNSGVY